jgi:hypothetical protein
MLGFDTLYRNDYDDAQLAEILRRAARAFDARPGAAQAENRDAWLLRARG